MPTVMQIGRYRFFFYSNENQEPAHIHVKAGADEAKFWLETERDRTLGHTAPNRICGDLE